MKSKITYEEKIKHLDEALTKAKNERNLALVNKEFLENELAKLNRKAEELGVNPEELETKIVEIRKEIDKLMEELEELIPEEFLKGV